MTWRQTSFSRKQIEMLSMLLTIMVNISQFALPGTIIKGTKIFSCPFHSYQDQIRKYVHANIIILFHFKAGLDSTVTENRQLWNAWDSEYYQAATCCILCWASYFTFLILSLFHEQNGENNSCWEPPCLVSEAVTPHG